MRKIIGLALCVAFSLVVLNPCPGFAYDRKKLARKYYEKGVAYFKAGKFTVAQKMFHKSLVLLEGDKKKGGQKEPAVKETANSSREKSRAKNKAGQRPLFRYLIAEEDILYITVWQDKDLTQEAAVRPDGMIAFPLVGDIPAVGMTLTELDKILTNKLKVYIKYPDVSIAVKKFGGKKIIVLGEVATPGVYAMEGKGNTVLEAIGLAGGFTKDAVPSSVIVIKGGAVNPVGIRLNMNRYLRKSDEPQNIILSPQDVIFVPKTFVSNVNYFVTQTLGPIMKTTYDLNELRSMRW